MANPNFFRVTSDVPTVPYEGDDQPIHTEESPYCNDPTCPCHWERSGRVDYTFDFARKRAQQLAQKRNTTTQTSDGEWW